MRETGVLHDTDITAIEAQVDAEITQAVGFAESGRWEPVAELARDVYAGEVAT
jgi:TPP-dependent pyruvate/acetoin dehydrogenase alpha subunit